jgi:hypothetical protein
MDIQRILVEYAKLHLQVTILQEQVAALQAQLKAQAPAPVSEPQQ